MVGAGNADNADKVAEGNPAPEANAAGASPDASAEKLKAPDADGEQSCEDTCNHRAELCGKVCDGGLSTEARKMSDADRDTCKVMCEANVRFCVDACDDASK